MIIFILKILAALAIAFMAKIAYNNKDEDSVLYLFSKGFLGKLIRVVPALLVFWAVVGTSMVWVSQGKFATLKRIYFGKSLTPGRIVALDGELGPQARILMAGFHWELFINLTQN